MHNNPSLIAYTVPSSVHRAYINRFSSTIQEEKAAHNSPQSAHSLHLHRAGWESSAEIQHV